MEEPFGVTPERMFSVLTMPEAIRSWWGASAVVIDPQKGGTLVTAAGDGVNSSEYINSFQILEFEPPNRMLLGGAKYFSGTSWPIKTTMTMEFLIDAVIAG